MDSFEWLQFSYHFSAKRTAAGPKYHIWATLDSHSSREDSEGILKNLSLLAILFLWSGSLGAVAGPPLITDDPMTPGPNRWEINLALTGDSGPFISHWDTPILDANYGVGEHIQLKYEAPWVISHQDGETQSGFDTSIVGVKWRFQDVTGTRPAISTYPQLTFATPVGAGLRNSLPGDAKGFLAPLEFQWHLDALELNEEIGYFFDEDSQNYWVLGTAASYEFREGWAAMAELHAYLMTDGSGRQLIYNLGLVRDFNPHYTLLLSAGHTLITYPDDPAEWLAYVGLQLHI
jgi:hypothetical protein